MIRPAFFFDRDGVVNLDPDPEPYVVSWDQWKWTPGLFDLLADVKARGFATILVTSQRCVGKGLLLPQDLEILHGRMQEILGDLAFDTIRVHTGLPNDPIPPKPDPGMIVSAMEEHALDLSRSWLIGDADRDIAMANAAGVSHTIRVLGLKPVTVPALHAVRTLMQVQPLLETILGPRPARA
jgi:D-glycero-D-manno-heptose 1,7-bisphosphate phosphatase